MLKWQRQIVRTSLNSSVRCSQCTGMSVKHKVGILNKYVTLAVGFFSLFENNTEDTGKERSSSLRERPRAAFCLCIGCWRKNFATKRILKIYQRGGYCGSGSVCSLCKLCKWFQAKIWIFTFSLKQLIISEKKSITKNNIKCVVMMLATLKSVFVIFTKCLVCVCACMCVCVFRHDISHFFHRLKFWWMCCWRMLMVAKQSSTSSLFCNMLLVL